MNYSQALKKLDTKNVEASDIDWLFCEILGCNRSELSATTISEKAVKKAKKYIKKLSKGLPLSQVLKKSYFLGEELKINRSVLTPRPETEELTDMLIKDINASNKPLSLVLDLCTGSGAIAIKVKKSTKSVVTATDISAKALKIAKYNAKKCGAKINYIKSNMFDKIFAVFDYIICNPPYIAYNDPLVDKNVKKFEPKIALFAPDNGYYFYKVIAQNYKNYLKTGGKLYLEVGDTMAEKVAAMFENATIIKDMYNKQRFVIVRN